MNSRNRLILLVLGVVALGGLLAAGYFFLVVPYLARLKGVERAEREAREAEDDRDDLQLKAQAWKLLRRRSLPAGPEYPDDPKRQKREYADTAKLEYEQALVKILKEAGARNSTVNFVDGESNNKTGIPLVDPKAKAPTRDDDPTDYLTYTQIVYKIDIPKTDLGTVAEVLRRYYSLDLLQQITHLNIKHTGQGEVGEDKRLEKDRTDLKVEITTRAIIVHDASHRRTLTYAPYSVAALLGGGGAASFQNSPAIGRKLWPDPIEPLLAYNPPRKYHDQVAKDFWHGLLPEPKDDGKKERDTVVTTPPKPDFREFIYYTTRIVTTQGDYQSLDITIKDKINKEDYNVLLTQVGEKVAVKVDKYGYENHKIDVTEQKKKMYSQDTLEISKWTMINKNNFTVYGIDTDDSLILGEKPSGLTPDLPKEDKAPPRVGGGGRPGFGGGSPKVTLPAPDPKAAVVGGLVVTAPKAEKFYRWEYGKTLKQIVELSKPEAEKAIRRAQTRFLPSTNAASTAEATPVAADAGK